MKKLLILLLLGLSAFMVQAQTYTATKFITKQEGYVELNNNNFYARLKASASASANITLFMPPNTPSNNTLWGFGSSGVTQAVAGVKGVSILSGEVYVDTAYAATRYKVGTLLGITSTADNLGTFTGVTIADASSVKTALQALETALELVSGGGVSPDSITAHRTDINNLQALTGRVDGSTHLSTFTGSTIADNVTIKVALQSLETAVEVRADSITAHRTDINNLQTLSGVADGSTSLATFTGGTIADNSTIKAALQALETAVEAAGGSNFANTNLTLTANRTHAGGGFSLTMTGVSAYSYTTNSGGRNFSMSSTDISVAGNNFQVKGAAGQGIAAPVLELWEDADNVLVNAYVGLRGPSNDYVTSRIWTIPSTDATSSNSVWMFDASEVASLFIVAGNSNQVIIGNGSSTGQRSDADFTAANDIVYVNKSGVTANSISYPIIISNLNGGNPTTAGIGVGIQFKCTQNALTDSVSIGKLRYVATDHALGSEDYSIIFSSMRAGTMTDQGTLNSLGNLSIVSLNLDKTITAAATTGAQTINKATGSVNFAAAATSLVVTNSLVTANSIILCTIGTVDATFTSCSCTAGVGSFTITANAAATAETRVNFLVTN